MSGVFILYPKFRAQTYRSQWFSSLSFYLNCHHLSIIVTQQLKIHWKINRTSNYSLELGFFSLPKSIIDFHFLHLIDFQSVLFRRHYHCMDFFSCIWMWVWQQWSNIKWFLFILMTHPLTPLELNTQRILKFSQLILNFIFQKKEKPLLFVKSHFFFPFSTKLLVSRLNVYNGIQNKSSFFIFFFI